MPRARRALVVAAVTAAAATAAAPALAAAVSQATGSATTTAATWGVSLGPNAGPAATGPYVMTFALTGGVIPTYFRAFNTGTLALTGSSWQNVNSKPSGNAPPTIGLVACVGADWNQTLGTCAGTQLALSDSDLTVPRAVALSIPVGGSVSVRAIATRLPNFPQPFTTTVTVTVARAQAAAGTTRTS